ncbi:hypothetical protein L6452_18027 [Arctium lappa]|uniref:Uncharacterized protein n=1 Tax=Arctium lappa TaxID=4217 RepID=A0ACB9C530_ARCLA|nr:hypothetical protein L6452_18027 [Arctium lappa]
MRIVNKPKIETVLQLIQLNYESNIDVHGHEFREVLASTMKRRRKKSRIFVVSRFEAEDNDEDDKDVAGSTRQKRKKFQPSPRSTR